MSIPTPPSVTDLLIDLQRGRDGALDALMPLVYDELRSLAGRVLHAERPDQTLQPTALVHEAYLRLVDQRTANYDGRTHFYSVAATLMRRIVVDMARRRNAAKRGGGLLVRLDTGVDAAIDDALDVVRVDEALDALAAIDPRQARVVELRFFAGLSTEETATLLGVSERTIKRDWAMARAWLHRALSAT
ncbi:MAG: sigma-70 family RNA polymerase sigma factor [Gemmatimonadota bacterium]